MIDTGIAGQPDIEKIMERNRELETLAHGHRKMELTLKNQAHDLHPLAGGYPSPAAGSPPGRMRSAP